MIENISFKCSNIVYSVLTQDKVIENSRVYQPIFISAKLYILYIYFIAQHQISAMSRGRSERHRERNNMEIDHFGRRMDPFSQMHQIMRSFGGGFGGLGNDFFGSDRNRDPFEEMMQFSDNHKKLHGSNNGGSYVCQTYVSSSTMGQDGKIKNQSYFQNSAGQNHQGQTISQKNQAYKNSEGIKRIAEERMLNDQGRKIVKEKRGNNEVEETNHYYNMDEEDVGRFDQSWQGVNQNMKFLENTNKIMKGLPYQGGNRREDQKALGYDPRREERRQPQYQQREPVRQEYRQPIQQQRMSGSRGQKMGGSRGNQGYQPTFNTYKGNSRRNN